VSDAEDEVRGQLLFLFP